MKEIMSDNEYREWLIDLKSKIKQSQIKASLAVNRELFNLYWDIGYMITLKQSQTKWGDGFINQIASDIKSEFSDLKGFSRENLYYMKRLYQTYSERISIMEQVVPQLPDGKMEQVVPQNHSSDIKQLLSSIPWGHNIVILKKVKIYDEALFYIHQTIENNWSRSILEMQIESNLYSRFGKSINNFQFTLPKAQSDLANALLKDPYNFNFLTMEKGVQELELEKQLVSNISRFLLELGKGFAYLGRQFQLQIGNKEYRLDLLFYNIKLRCYVVIELKTGEFQPEHIGKLNFYLSAIDHTLKTDSDNPSIGILLCKDKDSFEVEFALKDVNKPIGVSEFSFKELPLDIQIAMPTIEELEQELFKDDVMTMLNNCP